ncbi:hypothetical protein DENSPDRAFT_886636 [Dentipellis sp. KUC8613]|nr:hypothetical protein DENSPDRAFT_886636 [Dentipellis sp. KUC8613]
MDPWTPQLPRRGWRGGRREGGRTEGGEGVMTRVIHAAEYRPRAAPTRGRRPRSAMPSHRQGPSLAALSRRRALSHSSPPRYPAARAPWHHRAVAPPRAQCCAPTLAATHTRSAAMRHRATVTRPVQP